MLVCNLPSWLSQPFATECTNDAYGARAGPHVSAGTADISDINGCHYRNLRSTSLGGAAVSGTVPAGWHISSGRRCLGGGGTNEHNKFLCHVKCRLSALPGWPLWPIIGEANALVDISIWMDEMFFSFADTGDHTPIIITMVVYTSLCKCLLTQ